MSDYPLAVASQLAPTYTDAQRQTFADCEKRLNENQGAFLDYVQAMKTIQDQKLYVLKGFASFEAYLGDRISVITRTRQRTSQLVNHTMRVITLSEQPGIDTLPISERQTRPLAGLEPAEMSAVWLGAQVASESDQPSGSWVKSSRETLEEAWLMDTMVDTGTGNDTPITVGFTEATLNKELDRAEQVRAIIRAKRGKPLVVFEAAPQALFGDWLSMNMPPDVAQKLRVGQSVRFVVYPIGTLKKRETA